MPSYRYDGRRKFSISGFDCADTGSFKDRQEAVPAFIENLEKINEYQQKLFAEGKEGIIFVFQAMDAAGKDGAVRACLSCLSPQGCAEHSFKVPSAEEGRHDYLWRFWKALPEKGCISIFNRSYYEDVLVQKVHKLYRNYKFADRIDQDSIIDQRYEQIKSFEKYLWENSIRVVKIFLNVSKEEQGRRFISRIDTQKKNWKFSKGDVAEREYWDDYMEAYETCINRTATRNDPWYVVPADHKWYARYVISDIILRELKAADPHWPEVDPEELAAMDQIRARLALECDMLAGESLDNGDKIKPADTAISIAFKANRKASSEKKLRKKLTAYLREKLSSEAEINEETFDALSEICLDGEERQAAEELENAKHLSTVYDDNKDEVRALFSGYGKEADKLYKRFKRESKDSIALYEDAVNVIYSEYENAVGNAAIDYQKAITELGEAPEAALPAFKKTVDEAFGVSRDQAQKCMVNTESELNAIAAKYRDIAASLRAAGSAGDSGTTD